MENNTETTTTKMSDAEKASNISLIIMCVYLIGIFLNYFTNKLTFDSDLIPKSIVDLAFEESAILGLCLSIGLLFSSIARAYRNFKIAFIIDALSSVGIPTLWSIYNYFV